MPRRVCLSATFTPHTFTQLRGTFWNSALPVPVLLVQGLLINRKYAATPYIYLCAQGVEDVHDLLVQHADALGRYLLRDGQIVDTNIRHTRGHRQEGTA